MNIADVVVVLVLIAVKLVSLTAISIVQPTPVLAVEPVILLQLPQPLPINARVNFFSR